MDSMDKYRIFLSRLEYTGSYRIRKLLEYFGDEETIYKSSEDTLRRSGILTDKQMAAFTDCKKKYSPDELMERVLRSEINYVVYEDDLYPKRLYSITNPPYILYYYGRLPGDSTPQVAIIGSRGCSEYGRQSAKYFGSGLAGRGVGIISGMAGGIDGIAQNAAVDNGGYSCAILGCGIDICYPRSNEKLYHRLIDEGCVMSEYYPGTKPVAGHFPVRNRIISGLSDAVLVIEARERSGTLITVDMALEQGRDVLAVPGRISDALSYGCNRLISEGATPAMTIDSVLECLGGTDAFRDASEELIKRDVNNILNKDELRIYELIRDNTPVTDEIWNIIRDEDHIRSIEELNVLLFEMQLKDVIYAVGGRFYIK